MPRNIEQTESMIFVHHFPTHSVVWGVCETTYESMAEVADYYAPIQRDVFFEGRDGLIYMAWFPTSMRRVSADDYVSRESNPYIRYTVVDLTTHQQIGYEVDMVDCEYGCKNYKCTCGTIHIFHDSTYGCQNN